MKIRAGDTIVVITGKDKGKTGTVLRVLPLKQRVVVAGVNMRTKHVKKTVQRPGQRIQFEGSIAVSNVMLVDSKTKKRSRVGHVVDDKGRKRRVFKRSGEAIVRAKPVAAAKTTDPKAASTKAGTKAKTKGSTAETAADTPSPAPSGGHKPNIKQPFWKKMGFGAEAVEGAEVPGEAHAKEDHSVTKEGQSSGRRSHQRGS